MSNPKLPKQWLHWAQKAGLKPETPRWELTCFYLIGRGRRWRVNCNGDFECSCPTQFFDRWANSRGAIMSGIPRTQKEFISAVVELREASKNER